VTSYLTHTLLSLILNRVFGGRVWVNLFFFALKKPLILPPETPYLHGIKILPPNDEGLHPVFEKEKEREEEEGYLWGGSVGEKDRDRVVGVSFACPKKDSTCVSYNIKKDYKNELCLLDN